MKCGYVNLLLTGIFKVFLCKISFLKQCSMIEKVTMYCGFLFVQTHLHFFLIMQVKLSFCQRLTLLSCFSVVVVVVVFFLTH